VNFKILIAPVLAIALAVFIAGAINSSMLPMDNDMLINSTPEPSLGSTTTPVPAQSVAAPFSPFLFIGGAVVIAAIAILLFFREKSLNKALTG